MGTPTTVAMRTEKRVFAAQDALDDASGIQLWMSAPIPTPMSTYQKTFLTTDCSCSQRRTAVAARQLGDSMSTLPADRTKSSTYFSILNF
jgi:hypothetical protein